MDNRQENAKLHKKLKGKDASWEELKEDIVYKACSSTLCLV